MATSSRSDGSARRHSRCGKTRAKRHKLDVSFEWRQFFDRMSDPDVNYQFWGGLRYMFELRQPVYGGERR